TDDHRAETGRCVDRWRALESGMVLLRGSEPKRRESDVLAAVRRVSGHEDRDLDGPIGNNRELDGGSGSLDSSDQRPDGQALVVRRVSSQLSTRVWRFSCSPVDRTFLEGPRCHRDPATARKPAMSKAMPVIRSFAAPGGED